MDVSRYRYVVGYGIGQYYEYRKEQIKGQLHLDYLCDSQWEQFHGNYNGIPVISPDELKTLENAIVVIFSGNQRNYDSIANVLEKMRVPYIHADRVIEGEYTISGSELQKLEDRVYTDSKGNRIEFADDLTDAINITFIGNNNRIILGKGVSVGRLNICCGKNAVCTIEEGTVIEGAQFFITDGSVRIGKHCLLSYEVIVRNHDSHHIFDKNTGKRINYPGNIQIGNHVWIGQGVTLLGSANIGDNSVIGSKAVTSGTFPKEVIIAGNPARIIRENICWSKDNTDFYNRTSIEECLEKEALWYF